MVEKIAKRKKVDEEALRVMTMNILRRDYLGGPIENSGEVIDEEMRTLDFYALEHVDIVKEKPRVVLGFELPAFPVRQRETIYRKDSA
ncbi:MAG: hypothetical protein NT001_04310 [Candidatus Woesearchaeota archaeon]|nr:hypothetical protein [Candidatus Woesearchaeota archaeon]